MIANRFQSYHEVFTGAFEDLDCKGGQPSSYSSESGRGSFYSRFYDHSNSYDAEEGECKGEAEGEGEEEGEGEGEEEGEGQGERDGTPKDNDDDSAYQTGMKNKFFQCP